MAFTGSYVCTSFYTGILNGVFNFSTNTFRLSLYTNSATLDASTTAYTSSGEVPSTGGYSAGGTIVSPTVSVVQTQSGAVVLVDFSNAAWAASTISNARGALLYDDTAVGNPSVAVLDFGQNISSSGTTFTVQFPPSGANTSFLQFATVLTQ